MSSFLMDILYITLMSSIVIAAVFIIKAAFKNKLNAGVLSVLWILVVLRLILPITFNSPVHIGDWFVNSKTQAEAAAESETIVMSEDTSAEYSPSISEININSPTPIMDMQDYSTNGETDKPTIINRAIEAIKSIEIVPAIISVWIAVGLGIIFFSVFNLIKFVCTIRASETDDEKLRSVFIKAKHLVGLNKKISLITTDKIDIPITYGLIFTKVLVPEKLVNAVSEKELKLILMHELMHIKRMDILKNYLWLIAKAVHWFNPLVWIAYNQYISDIEILCDYSVAKRLNDSDRAVYTQSLVNAAKLVQKNNENAPLLLCFCSEDTKLRRRIMNILTPNKNSKKQIILIGTIIFVLIIACFTTACGQSDESTADVAVEPTPTQEVIEKTEEPGKSPETTAVITADEKGKAYGPYQLYFPSFPTIGSDEDEAMIDMIIDAPIVRAPLLDVFPVLDVEFKKFDDDAIDKAVNHLMGSDCTENEALIPNMHPIH